MTPLTAPSSEDKLSTQDLKKINSANNTKIDSDSLWRQLWQNHAIFDHICLRN